MNSLVILDFPQAGEREMNLFQEPSWCLQSFKTCGVVQNGDGNEPPKGTFGGQEIRNFFSSWMWKVVAQGEGRVQRGPSKNTVHLPKRHRPLLCGAPDSSSKGEIILSPMPPVTRQGQEAMVLQPGIWLRSYQFFSAVSLSEKWEDKSQMCVLD